jgi:hypothetical protein
MSTVVPSKIQCGVKQHTSAQQGHDDTISTYRSMSLQSMQVAGNGTSTMQGVLHSGLWDVITTGCPY